MNGTLARLLEGTFSSYGDRRHWSVDLKRVAVQRWCVDESLCGRGTKHPVELIFRIKRTHSLVPRD